MQISVIIPAKDAAQTISACLQAVLAQQAVSAPFEIIVVDDGSQDETAAVARSFGVAVLSQPNAGPAAARNAGAQQSAAELLVFLDADCIPAPEWLAALIAAFDDDQVVGARGAYRSHQTGVVPRFVQQEYQFKYDRIAHLPWIDFVDTYSAAYRREIFLQHGGFQAAFPHPSVEDQEFSFRLARQGYRMVFVPQAVVYHDHDRSLAEYVRRKLTIGYWKAFMLRWTPEKTFSDSHTPASQRWQIVFLGIAFSAAAFGFFWPPLLGFATAALLGFTLSSLPFAVYLLRAAPRLLLWFPVLLFCRTLALGIGLLLGFLFPPASIPVSPVLSPAQRLIKRAMDIVLAVAGLVFFFPWLLLAAVAIKLDSPGPVFFIQDRIGEHGKPFRMVKLRTMVHHAESRLAEVLAANPLDGPVFKIPGDPRVTRVGRLLRRWSLDEVPQFWNVLLGRMSIVGPRPEEPWVVAQYDLAQRQRLSFKPGLTGPMQVSGRGALDMAARLQVELAYIQNYSLGKDFSILLKTIPAVISGRGAF